MKEEERGKIKVYGRPRLKKALPLMYCPGCHYGIITSLIAEVIEEMGIEGDTIGVSSVGCTFITTQYFDLDFIDSAHGRSPAVATGIKHAHFGKPIVFTIQGDGDLAAIGMGCIINAINRFEKITTIFLNNANYGTTGGQLAPTTLLGQKTTTTPDGRDPKTAGFPIHIAEFLSNLKGVAYSARCAVNTPANYNRAKKALKNAFQKQIDGVGYSIVEFLSACPGSWKLTASEAMKRIAEDMIPEYPLGEFKNVERII
ncbi:MAG: 2-oxoglutarate ferredoxin oxidoreductase subunit beta [bacterium]|nr:MAG: 2-oxoglutarate ferredoxin oxidoreductase subunit beta [bacterium]